MAFKIRKFSYGGRRVICGEERSREELDSEFDSDLDMQQVTNPMTNEEFCVFAIDAALPFTSKDGAVTVVNADDLCVIIQWAARDEDIKITDCD